MTHDNKLQVEAIKRGTVIDHIPAQIGFKLLSLFKLTETIAHHHRSELAFWRDGPQNLIKIENTFLSEDQVNELALSAPQATVNRIDDYEVVGRRPVRRAHRRCWSARTATVSAMPNRFLPALPCENTP
ncbi:aspartate carbamoyltransferase regulatory subunit [Escherichia coli]